MTEKQGNLGNVVAYFSKLVGATMKGNVIPVTLEPSEICFQTESGREYFGEHRLDEMRMSADRVVKIWLQQEIKANEVALRAVKEAEVIVLCPGSLFGSIIINFLPKGMSEAYIKSKAKKLLMTNIMSTANESDGFDQSNYINAFIPYLGKDPIDLVIMASTKNLEKRLVEKAWSSYALERQFPIHYDKTCKVKTIVADIALIEVEHRRFRHSEEKLANFFGMLSLN